MGAQRRVNPPDAAPWDARFGIVACPVCRTDVAVTAAATYPRHEHRDGRLCRSSWRPVPLLAVRSETLPA